MSVQDCHRLPQAAHACINESHEKRQWKGRAVTNASKSTQRDLPQGKSIPPKNIFAKIKKKSEALKRPRLDKTDFDRFSSAAQPAKKRKKEMQVVFIHGIENHIDTYAKCIDEAESDIIIASWSLNFIPKKIFYSLMQAKKREISISFIVQSVKRKETLKYFDDNEESASDYGFGLFETKSHAKFLFVDSKTLVLGSFNALGGSLEEVLETSVMLKGTVGQLWPFYMSIRETYTSIEEDLSHIFGGIAMISKMRHPGPRPLLQRYCEDDSQIFLLRTIQEHEEFFKLATPYNGNVSIYSPFSTKDNTFKRLQVLDKILPAAVKVSLKVLPRFRNGLTRLLEKVPNLQNRANIEATSSHQKVIILGTEIICIGSLNWLSAAQDSKAFYSNVEFSIVLQGPKAAGIIRNFY